MLDLFLLGLAALLVWVRQLLVSADQRNADLLNSNYQLARLNEDLFVALDQHKPLATLLSCIAYRN